MLSIARRLRSEVSTDSGHEVTPRRGEQIVDQMVTSFALNIAARESPIGGSFPAHRRLSTREGRRIQLQAGAVLIAASRRGRKTPGGFMRPTLPWRKTARHRESFETDANAYRRRAWSRCRLEPDRRNPQNHYWAW